MKNLLIISILIISIAISCKKQEDICLPVTNDLLQGSWEDYCNQCYNLGGRTYNIFFDENYFYLEKIEYSDLVLVSCNNINSWSQYVKGMYAFSDGIMTLNGFYSDENYNILENSTCPQVIDTGTFYMEFNNVVYCNDTLILQNTNLTEWEGMLKLKKE